MDEVRGPVSHAGVHFSRLLSMCPVSRVWPKHSVAMHCRDVVMDLVEAQAKEARQKLDELVAMETGMQVHVSDCDFRKK